MKLHKLKIYLNQQTNPNPAGLLVVILCLSGNSAEIFTKLINNEYFRNRRFTFRSSE
jgi:hypothetical protein